MIRFIIRSFRFQRLVPSRRDFSHAASPTIQKKKDRTNYDLVTPVIQSMLRSGSVIVSTLESIFDNLALEEWIYRHYDFSVGNDSVLLLWTNGPAVVVGRHQNVWLETSVRYCRQNDIDIARRNSGGGTVYHDQNNLNLSFITSRKRYDRTKNLTFLRDILWQCFNIRAEISPRKDLIIEGGQKISGTASKLNSHNSYHHCTLLVDVDRRRMHDSLRNEPLPEVTTNATRSVPASTVNLSTLNDSLTMDRLIGTISERFGQQESATGSSPLVTKISETEIFNEMKEIQQMYRSWSWIYGSTPRFTIAVTPELSLVIERGCIKEFKCNTPKQLLDYHHSLVGVRFEQSCLREAMAETYPKNDKLATAILESYQRLVGKNPS